MSGTLQGLARQLSEVFHRPAGDFAAEAGAADLAAALGEFTTNWSIRQRNLLDDLNDLARVSEAAAGALKASDEDLAKALNGALTTAETPPNPNPPSQNPNPPHRGRGYE